MRCLTLADALRAKNCDVSFLVNDFFGVDQILDRAGFAYHFVEDRLDVPSDMVLRELMNRHVDPGDSRLDRGAGVVDWLFVDDYQIDHEWHHRARGVAERIAVLDDLADRPYDCDLLIDQNFGATAEAYKSLVPTTCEVLAGPKFALLRDEFRQLRESRKLLPELLSRRKIFLNFGGSDFGGTTLRVLNALEKCEIAAEYHYVLAVGSGAPTLNLIKSKVDQTTLSVSLHVSPPNMAALMCDCFFAIGAAGSSAWERCCLGIPFVQVVVADNQRSVARSLEYSGIAMAIELDDLSHSAVHKIFEGYVKDEAKLTRSSSLGLELIDGMGSQRVAEKVRRIN
jgi:UDP-2,4-diacetamido-2,4,6-trideoxy-beta-L-altropyranose hydrolase